MFIYMHIYMHFMWGNYFRCFKKNQKEIRDWNKIDPKFFGTNPEFVTN